MGFVKEFKEFAIRGNVVDLAVVTSLVDDIITPAILTPALRAAHLSNLSELVIPGTAIKYGNFLSAIISFIIVAFALFLIVKGINSTKKNKVIDVGAPSSTDQLLMQIRDELKSRS